MRRVVLLILILSGIFSLAANARAEEYRFGADERGGAQIGEAWDGFLDALPPDAALRDADLSDPLEAVRTVREAADPGAILKRLLGMLTDAAEMVVPAAGPLFGLLLLCASLRAAVPAGQSAQTGEAFLRVARLAVSVTVFRLAGGALRLAESASGTVCRLAELLIPVTEGICLLGGGVTEGRVARVGLMLALTIAEEAAGRVLIPAAGVTLGLAAVSGGRGVVGRAAGAFRKLLLRLWQTVAVGMTFLLGAQSVLAKTADSAGLRWSKFALSSFVPVAGSALSDAWGTISSGLRVLRGAAGIGGILALGAAALPAAVPLLLWQAVFSLAAAAADALGLGEISPILSEAGGIVGMLAAFTLYTLAMFTVELALFAGIGTA